MSFVWLTVALGRDWRQGRGAFELVEVTSTVPLE